MKNKNLDIKLKNELLKAIKDNRLMDFISWDGYGFSNITLVDIIKELSYQISEKEDDQKRLDVIDYLMESWDME